MVAEMHNRELLYLVDELDQVAGGNPILGFIIGYVAAKVLDKLAPPLENPQQYWKCVEGGGNPYTC